MQIDYRIDSCLAPIKNQGSVSIISDNNGLLIIKVLENSAVAAGHLQPSLHLNSVSAKILVRQSRLGNFQQKNRSVKFRGTWAFLSEQQLVDCDTGNSGCNGGWYTSAWNYLKAGSATSAAYPYTAAVRWGCMFYESEDNKNDV